MKKQRGRLRRGNRERTNRALFRMIEAICIWKSGLRGFVERAHLDLLLFIINTQRYSNFDVNL